MNITPAIEVGQSYRVGTDLHTVTAAASSLRGVTVYRTASNYAKTYAIGEFEAMVADSRAVLLVPVEVAAEQRYADLSGAVRTVISVGDGRVVCRDELSRRRVTTSYERFAARIANGTLTLIECCTPATETTEQSLAVLERITAVQDERREAVAMLDAMLTHPTRTPESIAYVARAALRILTEANGADSLSGLALLELDARHPARPVTVTRKSNGTTWHLVNRYGHQVEAGEYVTDSGRRFTIAESPATTVRPVDGEPLSVWVSWYESVPGADPYAWQALDSLVKGWHWERAAV